MSKSPSISVKVKTLYCALKNPNRHMGSFCPLFGVYRGLSDWGVKLILNLAPGLIINGFIGLLPPYAFFACTGTTFLCSSILQPYHTLNFNTIFTYTHTHENLFSKSHPFYFPSSLYTSLSASHKNISQQNDCKAALPASPQI